MHRTIHKSRRDWHLQINPTLWAYGISINMPIGATSFSLVYGSKVVLQLEVEIPSLWVSLRGMVIGEDYIAMWIQELKILD